MFKYLAGIFAKPRNDYVDGRLTNVAKPGNSSQVKASLKKVVRGKGKPEVREPRRRREEKLGMRPCSRTTTKSPSIQLEPISYIVDVAESSSFNDDGETTIEDNDLCSKPLEDQDQKKVDFSYIVRPSTPIAPPVTRIQSWMSCATAPLDANPFSEHDGLDVQMQLSDVEIDEMIESFTINEDDFF
ncbi:uncharacterized protein LOC108091041 [Drosophila ficusphila]|uniref:uncharacterized protein LOC108091041 n=1 Tax=Drosophila ficusphila TaxID=30025 RepID=UPI0007E6DD0D|nr:uncharacterized protein LOC108091041 [Drosophila ficusphila]